MAGHRFIASALGAFALTTLATSEAELASVAQAATASSSTPATHT